MKKVLALLLLASFLAGCSTYKFQRGEQKPFDQGYVVYRDGFMIPEYSLGENNSVPNDLDLAKYRFKRRRKTVEYYYRKLGDIHNGFERYFWNPCGMVIKTIFGQFRLPFVAVSNYKYNHNPEYKKKIIQIEEEREAKEKARVGQIKGQLNTYVQKDLASEHYVPVAITETAQPVKIKLPAQKETTYPTPVIPQATAITVLKQPDQPKAKSEEITSGKEVKTSFTTDGLTATISAKPDKGFSPLNVHFYGSKSSSAGGKIISYLWDFGDGDTSTKKDPINIYYSGSFEPREFTATLTVQDEKGNTAKTSTEIQVLNK